LETKSREEIIYEQKRERDYKRFFFLWLKRVLIGYVIGMAIYFVWLFSIQGLTIEWIGGVQRNYAKFLVEKNDEFITHMIEFEALTSKTGSVYTSAEKESIAKSLEQQNEFLKKMQKLSPDETNTDYLDIYQDMLQIYAFYIQGEVMKAEYCYNFSNNFVAEDEYSNSTTSIETYTMGQELCNMMGNMILNNFKYINQVRDTSYKSKHNIVEIGNNSSSTPETDDNVKIEDKDDNIVVKPEDDIIDDSNVEREEESNNVSTEVPIQ
jgi:hypothetical protein